MRGEGTASPKRTGKSLETPMVIGTNGRPLAYARSYDERLSLPADLSAIASAAAEAFLTSVALAKEMAKEGGPSQQSVRAY